MHLRRDALAAAAEWITAVEALAPTTEGLVATVGKIEVTPNAGNVIAGTCQMSLDVRHRTMPCASSAVDELLEQAEQIADAARTGVRSATRQMDQPAVPMDERLTAFMTDVDRGRGFPVQNNAQRRRPRCHGDGRPHAHGDALSAQPRRHQPSSREAVREEDVEAALQVGAKFLERLAAEVR